MKNLLNTYKPFLKFLLIFFVSYGTLTLLYNTYLNQYKEDLYPLDPFTVSVSDQVKILSDFFTDKVDVKQYMKDKWTIVEFNQKNVARIVEGCNAVSVMILFVSFVLAFAKKIKPTILFILFGLATIHLLNVGRIALLSVLLYHYKEHTHLLHGVLFPLIIYGYVFFLWVIWVKIVFKPYKD